MGVRLLVLHPRLVERTCARCQAWLYDDDHRLIKRHGYAVPRPRGCPTPCWRCPKRSPRQGCALERDLPRIIRTVQLYREVRATAGRCLSDRQAADARLARNLAIVEHALLVVSR